jgi:hypothetical protein
VSESSRDLDALVDLARLVTPPGAGRDLVLARLVAVHPGRDPSGRLREVTVGLAELREVLASEGFDARVAAFSSSSPGRDLLKLAQHQDADLILLNGERALVEGSTSLADDLLAQAPADVALYLARAEPASGSVLLVPFSGSEHDWAALELAAHIARYASSPLVLAGVEAARADEQDASRLLATASLVIQRTSGVTAEPVLVPPGPDGILAQAADARLVVVGLSARFRETGLGETRYEIARRSPAPVLFIRRGARPGVLSPTSTLTRFGWSLSAGRVSRPDIRPLCVS